MLGLSRGIESIENMYIIMHSNLLGRLTESEAREFTVATCVLETWRTQQLLSP